MLILLSLSQGIYAVILIMSVEVLIQKKGPLKLPNICSQSSLEHYFHLIRWGNMLHPKLSSQFQLKIFMRIGGMNLLRK